MAQGHEYGITNEGSNQLIQTSTSFSRVFSALEQGLDIYKVFHFSFINTLLLSATANSTC